MTTTTMMMMIMMTTMTTMTTTMTMVMTMTMTMMMMMRNDPEIGSVIGWHTQPLNNIAVPGQKFQNVKFLMTCLKSIQVLYFKNKTKYFPLRQNEDRVRNSTLSQMDRQTK